MKIKTILVFCMLIILVMGCAKPPLTEMQDAREAVFRAENDQNAVLFAGSVLERARASLQRMQDEADNKRYDAAKSHAAEAISMAERAIADGRTGALRAGDESASLISNLRPEIEETERNVNGARYSLLNLDYDLLEREIINAHEAADKAEASQAEGRYQDALQIARELREDLSNINNRVAGAAITGKK
jgi:predicted S18 family serine protease